MLQDLFDFFTDKTKKSLEKIKRQEKIDKMLEEAITLNDIRFQTRTYETVIPLVFGELLIAGNILWLSEIRVKLKSSYSNSFNGKFITVGGITNLVDLVSNITGNLVPEKENLSLEYRIDFAIGICEGKVDELLGVYINGEAVDTSQYNFRFYKGDEEQLPDQALIKEKGEGNVPAFRGMCYAVFEDFDLTSFGRSIPNFEFFIRRSNFARSEQNITGKIKQKLKGVNLMPGSGEFVYETKPNVIYSGVFYNNQNMVDGKVKHSNVNTFHKKADSLVALDLLKEDLPNLEWVSLVVTWFTDSLDVSKASIFPASEFNDLKTVSSPIFWEVAGVKRWYSRQVSRRKDGSLNYGGTVSDTSVISILKELKGRGYKIKFYPMIFVDLEEKPWRGRMTGKPSDIPNFFAKSNGYNNFITHYAKLTKELCDVFVIGSEMVGLTGIRAENGTYPAVNEFVKLARTVKSINPSIKVTYAADWSEYHSSNGYYNMDALWASPNIDFIGLDAYFPLTDIKRKPKIEEIKEGWASGEGYEYYISEGKKKYYEDARFAWKNMRFFLENEHINIDGTKTEFVPNSKKIWFTEFGFPSVDLCSNQPNVFYDPTSNESFLPKFSRGIVDFESQKEAIVASLEFIEENSDIIENAFCWCYDLRPYPFFPKRKDIWADGDLWQKGHWLNGKLGSSTFDEVVRELGMKAGLLEEEMVFEDCNDIVEGFCINKDLTFEYYIKMLCEVYFVKMVSSPEGLKFRSIERSNFTKEIELNSEDTLTAKNNKTTVSFETEFSASEVPSKIVFSFIDKANRYEASNLNFEYNAVSNTISKRIQVSIPVVFSKERATQISINLLKQKRLESIKRKFSLPFSYNDVNSGDIILINNEKIFIESVKMGENFNIVIEGTLMLKLEPFIPEYENGNEILITNFLFENSKFLALELPELISSETEKEFNIICLFAKNLKQNTKLYYSSEGFPQNYLLGMLMKEQISGKIIEGKLYENMVSGILDKASYIEVFIENSSKGLKPEAGTAIIGGEICEFLSVVSKGDGVFCLSNFIRKKFNNIKIKGFEKEDFLLISSNSHNFTFPSYIKNISFIVVEGLKNEETIIPFEVKGSFEKKYYIGSKKQKSLKEGILLYWCFCEYSDFRHFEKTIWQNFNLELSFKNSDKKFNIKGEEFVLTNELRFELFGLQKNFLDFEVRIL